MAPGEERWGQQLLFRDRLRASPEVRAEYAAVKARAAAAHGTDREAYGHAKQEFVLGVVVGSVPPRSS